MPQPRTHKEKSASRPQPTPSSARTALGATVVPWGDPHAHETWKSGARDDGSRWRDLSAPPADRDDEELTDPDLDDVRTGASEATQDYAHSPDDDGPPTEA